MANRHKFARGGSAGGREKIYGNDQVFASAKKGTRPGAIQKAEGGKVIGKATGGRLDKRARGGGVGGGGGSPFSSARFKDGGAVKKG